jgi:hypothetical protein
MKQEYQRCMPAALQLLQSYKLTRTAQRVTQQVVCAASQVIRLGGYTEESEPALQWGAR